MAFQFGGGDSQAYSFTGLGPFSNPQPAPPPSVFDFSATKLSNFTNFPTTRHGFYPGAAGVTQPALFVPVFVLPVMPVLVSGGFAAAVPITQFPGSAAVAPPFNESKNKVPDFGRSCESCGGFPTTLPAAFPPSPVFGGPSSGAA